MNTINRLAVVVIPAQPFLDWLHQAGPTSAQLRAVIKLPVLVNVPVDCAITVEVWITTPTTNMIGRTKFDFTRPKIRFHEDLIFLPPRVPGTASR